jgi:hypothetical protein
MYKWMRASASKRAASSGLAQALDEPLAPAGKLSQIG